VETLRGFDSRRLHLRFPNRDRDNRYIRRVIETGNRASDVRAAAGFDFSPRQALYYDDHPDAIIEDFDRSEYDAVDMMLEVQDLIRSIAVRRTLTVAFR
jgi:hypothetical protein